MVFDAQRSKQEMAMKAQSSRHDMVLKTATTRSNIQNGAMKTASDAADTEDSGDTPDPEEMDLFGNKALASSMSEMSQAIVQMAQANAESQRMMAEGVAMLASELEHARTQPKQIVRGPDGRAVGVQ